jgi:hypothetical protein
VQIPELVDEDAAARTVLEQPGFTVGGDVLVTGILCESDPVASRAERVARLAVRRLPVKQPATAGALLCFLLHPSVVSGPGLSDPARQSAVYDVCKCRLPRSLGAKEQDGAEPGISTDGNLLENLKNRHTVPDVTVSIGGFVATSDGRFRAPACG